MRQRAGLRRPRRGDAGAVPVTHRRRPLHRCIDAHHEQPWWFSTRTGSRDPGRFDLAAPAGTCYLALSAVAAIIERTADPDADDPPVVTTRALANLRVWSGRVPSARNLADTTRSSVPRLTAEISTIVPFELPWAWADAFHGAGRHGLLYRGRFSNEDSVALFCEEAGAPDPRRSADPRERGRLDPSQALEHADRLPPAFVSGVGVVGAFDRYTRGKGPSR